MKELNYEYQSHFIRWCNKNGAIGQSLDQEKALKFFNKIAKITGCKMICSSMQEPTMFNDYCNGVTIKAFSKTTSGKDILNTIEVDFKDEDKYRSECKENLERIYNKLEFLKNRIENDDSRYEILKSIYLNLENALRGLS